MGNDIDRRILNVMTSVFDTSLDKKQDDISTETVESWDSLKHMNLIIALEEEFEIQFTDNQIFEMVSYTKIKSVIDYLFKK